MFELKKRIMKFLLLLGVREAELDNGVLVVRGEGPDEDTMTRKINEILLSKPGCLSCFSSNGI